MPPNRNLFVTNTPLLKQKEATTEEKQQRTTARSKKLKRNIIVSLLVKGGSIAIGLVLVPLTIHYVSPSQYGIWLTLSSIIGWFSFFDIGFGHGLRNKLAEAVANEDYALAKTYVSTTYAVLFLIIASVLGLFIAINPLLNWSAILNAPPEMRGELQVLGLVVLCFFCVQMVLQLLGTVLTANQQPAIASMVTFGSNVVSLAVIFMLTKLTAGNLVYLGVTLSASPVLAFMLASIWLYRGRYRPFAPSLQFVRFQYARKLVTLGVKFFILQVGAIILFQTNNVIISHLFSPEYVTSYNITYKYFGVVLMGFGIIVSPFWSAATEAWIKGDLDWIKGIIRKLQGIFLLLLVALLIMLSVAGPVYKLWIGENITIPFSLSVAVAICTALQIWQAIYLQFLNGISKVMLEMYLVIFTSVLNVPLAIFLGKQFGVTGVVLSSIILFSLFGICMFIQTRKIINHNAQGIWNR